MPFIQLTISGPENPDLAAEAAKIISTLTTDILHKKPEITVVTVGFVPDHLWFVNSVSLAGLKQTSYHLSVRISDSTNLRTDKEAYIGAVHQAMATLPGNLHPVSYTAIDEMKADAYGYAGSTIEYKLVSNKIKNGG